MIRNDFLQLKTDTTSYSGINFNSKIMKRANKIMAISCRNGNLLAVVMLVEKLAFQLSMFPHTPKTYRDHFMI